MGYASDTDLSALGFAAAGLVRWYTRFFGLRPVSSLLDTRRNSAVKTFGTARVNQVYFVVANSTQGQFAVVDA